MRTLILLASMLPYVMFAQNDKRDVLNPDQLAFKEFNLEAQMQAPAGIKLPFKNIKIHDSRFDTSKISYVPNMDGLAGKMNAFRKMTLRGGIANAIQAYYNDYYAASFTPNDFELLIVMKRFWISGNNRSINRRIEVAKLGKTNSSIYCKWEYYLGKNGTYLPVKRVDTIFEIDENMLNYLNEKLSERRLHYLKSCLHTLIEVLDFTNGIIQFDKQPKKSFQEIATFNNKMNNIPVLKDSGFKKGVYLSFDDFRNNRPSIKEFREKKMHYGSFNANTEIFLEDMKGETISNYWGYSDGKDFRYGMLGNEKIYRIQNTFCFFIKVLGNTIDRDNRALYGGSGINQMSINKNEIWVPFQFDMETGEVY